MTEPVLWRREEHTAAKHKLLRGFFVKWLSVHSSFFASVGGGLVRVYDGFAGPGVYIDGEPGSPRILVEELLDNPNLQDRWAKVRYEFAFVEQDARRAKMLQSVLEDGEVARRQAGSWPENVSWSVTPGRYEEHVPQPAREKHSALFLFLDPFGYSHSPMLLTRQLVQQPKSDTLIFLPLSFVNRFAGREGQGVALDRLFGTDRWRTIPNGPSRPRHLLDLFQHQLREAGLEHTLAFRLQPPDGSNEYWIVGASGHLAGFDSIKSGFWAVDPVHGQGFKATQPAAPGQIGLFAESEPELDGPDTSGLLALLREAFADRWFTVEDAIDVTKRSRFLDTHLKKRTLAVAERREQLEVDRSGGGSQFKEGRGTRMRFR